MAKQSKKTAGQRGTVAQEGSGVSIWQHLARQTTAQITPEFANWFQEHGGQADAGEEDPFPRAGCRC